MIDVLMSFKLAEDDCDLDKIADRFNNSDITLGVGKEGYLGAFVTVSNAADILDEIDRIKALVPGAVLLKTTQVEINEGPQDS